MTRAQTVKFVSALAFIAGLAGGFVAQSVSAEPIEGLSGLKPMSQAELASNVGGFMLPNGMNVNIGLMVQSAVQSALGNLTVKTTFSTQDGPNAPIMTTVTTNNSSTTSNGPISVTLPGNGGTTTIVQNAQGGLSTVITNSANNVDINQQKTISVDVGNYYANMKPVLAGNLIQLRMQTNWTHGIH
jgi:hypothetical protein